MQATAALFVSNSKFNSIQRLESTMGKLVRIYDIAYYFIYGSIPRRQVEAATF